MKPRAIVRAFNIVLIFDTEKNDDQISAQVDKLIREINNTLAKNFPKEIPQIEIEIENGKKKLKIGVKPIE